MISMLKRLHDKFLGQNAAIFYQKSPSLPLLEEWRQRSLPDFLRHLMRLEREERTLFVSAIKSWYQKQIFVSQCSSVGKELKVGPHPIRVMRTPSSRLIIGEGVVIYTPCEFVVTNHIFSESFIEIGDGVRIGANSSIRAAKKVTIGRNCLIAPWVRIADYNGHPLRPGLKRTGAPTPPDEVEAVTIGDNVWIGENSFIQRGVHVGKDSIVGANSVVTKSVPEGTIVLGNPARVALRLVDLDRIPVRADAAAVEPSSPKEVIS